MTTNLVVADPDRTEKTICLAVSPSLKAYGIPGRPRLFEVVEKVREENARRRGIAPGRVLTGASVSAPELSARPELAADYLIAPPRMGLYLEYSSRVYGVYLKYIAPEDIHVYSIDEVIMDVTAYLQMYRVSPRELAMRMILDVLRTTGITATAGIGTNMYLCKVAMDIGAKHIPPDENGVRIAELDEMSYRRTLWAHRPLTDFWRVGRGYARRLEAAGLYTMGDIARYSLSQAGEDRLYRMFGVNAELLIDHAWGWEPCTMADVKAYTPEENSISSGQVLRTPYPFEKAELIVREMADLLALNLVEKRLVTDQIVLTVGYDVSSLADPELRGSYSGEIAADPYGRPVPKSARGSAGLERHTSSARLLVRAALDLFERIVDRRLPVRRLNLTANHVLSEASAPAVPDWEQLDLFTDPEQAQKEREREEEALSRERKIQQTVLDIRKKYGNNAVLKGTDLQEGATTKERNGQIGGHTAWR